MKVTIEMTDVMEQLIKIAATPYAYLEPYTEDSDMTYLVRTFLEWAIREELYRAIKDAPWDKVSAYVRDGMKQTDPYMYEQCLHTFKMCEFKDENGNDMTNEEIRREATGWQARNTYVKLWEA